LANVACGVLVNLSFAPYIAPQAHFGVYGGSYGFDGCHTTYDPNESWGARFASKPPEYWAARGIFHPSDRQMWIDRGVFKPPAEGPPK
jgi:hypothetical protein